MTLRGEFEHFYAAKWAKGTGFWVDRYPAWLGLYADLCHQRNREILAALPEQVEVAVDLGCGIGDIVALLAPRARLTVGIDLAQVNLITCRENLADTRGVGLALGSAERLPFRDGTVDAIIMADVIEHVVDRDAVLAELARVLRPGGHAVLVTPDAKVHGAIGRLDGAADLALQTARRLLRAARGRPHTPPAPRGSDVYEEFLTRDELAALVTRHGLRTTRHTNVAFYPGPEGGGTFAYFLSLLRGRDRLRMQLVEPVLRPLFALAARARRFNQKQMIVATKD